MQAAAPVRLGASRQECGWGPQLAHVLEALRGSQITGCQPLLFRVLPANVLAGTCSTDTRPHACVLHQPADDAWKRARRRLVVRAYTLARRARPTAVVNQPAPVEGARTAAVLSVIQNLANMLRAQVSAVHPCGLPLQAARPQGARKPTTPWIVKAASKQEWEPSGGRASQGKPSEQDRLADVRARLQSAQAKEEQRERVRRALQDVDAELAGDGEEDPYWVPFDDCPGAGEHCAACWGCPEEIMKLR
ncbi:hypothetical protein C2E21_1129 [Chlorella sorokiniana]|uniref:Uncharacterized protein n=1 Tax=Chlorella sorokiniana TaxID=3076 RepID=A0A2P6U1W6_CHLSO|nr:hypothetical protein C2E21_1129 [Chlorella sorokiniana]|eukprot:PRW60305.1 hypothetical protein C2E21_1129 [Chlorella sorokiniana]